MNVSTSLQYLPDPVQSGGELVSPTVLVEQAQGIAALSRIDSVLVVCEVCLYDFR
jgi:hypothetical protein